MENAGGFAKRFLARFFEAGSGRRGRRGGVSNRKAGGDRMELRKQRQFGPKAL